MPGTLPGHVALTHNLKVDQCKQMTSFLTEVNQNTTVQVFNNLEAHELEVKIYCPKVHLIININLHNRNQWAKENVKIIHELRKLKFCKHKARYNITGCEQYTYNILSNHLIPANKITKRVPLCTQLQSMK